MNDEALNGRKKTDHIPEDDMPWVLQALVLQSPISTWVANSEGTCIFSNEAAYRLFGVADRSEVVGKYNVFKDDELIRQGFIPRIRQVFEAGGYAELLVDYDFSKVKHVTPSHPTHRVLRLFLFAVKDASDRIRYVVFQHEDLTEKQLAEQKEQEALKRLRQLEEIINRSPVVVFIWAASAGWPVDFVSESVRQFGYSPEEFTSGGIKYADIIHPGDLQRVDDEVSTYSREGWNEFTQEYRIFAKSGDVRWIDDHTWIRRDSQGAITHYQGMVFDITERRRAEEELRRFEAELGRRVEERTAEAESVNRQLRDEISDREHAEEALREREEQLRTLINAMPDIVCFKDGKGRWLEANDFDLQLFNLVGVDYRGKTDCDLADYSEYYREAFNTCGETDEAAWRAGKMVRADEIIPVEGDGSLVFDIIKVPTFYPNGDRKGLVVIGRDITERSRAEEALKASERRLADIINFLPDATMVIDPDGKVIAWNRAIEDLTGIRAEDMIGKGNYAYSIPFYGKRRPMLIDVVLKPSEAERIYTTLKVEGSTLTAEAYTPVMIPGGAYLWGKATPLYDAQGHVVGAIESIRDITERVRAEEASKAVEYHKRDFYRRTIMAATGNKLVITDRNEIEHIAGPELKSWTIKNGEDLGIVRNEAAGIARDAGMNEARIYDFILTIGESTTNAFKHAGGGTASIHRTDGTFIFIVSDEGPGIETLVLPEVALVRGYSTAGTLGMGYKAIISIADKVYLATDPTGTTVAVQMTILQAEEPVLSAAILDTWTA